MTAFSARLGLPGHSRIPLGVEVDVSEGRIRLNAGDQPVADWALEGLDVVCLSDGFHIKVDGEELILNVADRSRFATELGITQHPSSGAPANGRRSAEKVAVDDRRNGQPLTATPEEDVGDMRRRIRGIADALASNSVTPAEAFGQWLSLLKELNRRHEQGSIPTDQFHEWNTALLDLIPEPVPSPT